MERILTRRARGTLLWATLIGAALWGPGLGCGPGADPGSKASLSRTVDSNGGSYTVKFQTHPELVPLNLPFDVRFSVECKGPSRMSPGAGAPEVEVDARMPAHFHGMNRVPKVTQQADGIFVAEGLLFHMPGHWELYFDITQGGKTERAQVDVELK